MITTTAQDVEFRKLYVAIQEAYSRPMNDGHGYPVLEAEKSKTKDFVDAVTQLKKLADAIAANGESNLLPPKPEDFGKMTNAGPDPLVEAAKKRAHDAQMKRH